MATCPVRARDAAVLEPEVASVVAAAAVAPRPRSRTSAVAELVEASAVPSTGSGTVVDSGTWPAASPFVVAFPALPAASPGPPPESSPHRPLPLAPVAFDRLRNRGSARRNARARGHGRAPRSRQPPRSLSLSKRPRSLRQAQGPLPAAWRCAVAFLAPPVASPGPPPGSRFPQSPPPPSRQHRPRSSSRLQRDETPEPTVPAVAAAAAVAATQPRAGLPRTAAPARNASGR